MIVLGIWGARMYGFLLFLMTPTVMGVVTGVIMSRRPGVSPARTMVAAVMSLFIAALLMWGLGREGAICLLMSLPLSIPLAMFGALAGIRLGADPGQRSPGVGSMIVCMAALPVAFIAEPALLRDPAPAVSVTSIEIDAAPAVVWRHMLAFDDMPASDRWMYRAGIARPINARLVGRGVGATRTCEFTTGTFVEHIDAWEDNRRLRFSFLSTPPPLTEWSPYAGVHPPHLDGYFVPQWSEFRVVPLPGGRTRLEGTGVYVNRMRPATYWNAWTRAVIHRVHLTVFEHVKRLAEADARATAWVRSDTPGT
jgi:hypothetical protein